MTSLNELEAQLRTGLDEAGSTWLDTACASVADDPIAIRSRFPAAGRHVGRAPLEDGADPADPFAWTRDDVARTLLLRACGQAAADEVGDLYRFGDTPERRGVLRALEHLSLPDETARWLIDDAIRTNDVRLIAAALGPFGVRTLAEEALRQAVLKCVFVGLPINRLDGLDQRATPQLSRMLAEYVLERVAAGRSVPNDVWPFIDRFAPDDVLERIAAEAQSPHEDRRAAAAAALAARAQAHPLAQSQESAS